MTGKHSKTRGLKQTYFFKQDIDISRPYKFDLTMADIHALDKHCRVCGGTLKRGKAPPHPCSEQQEALLATFVPMSEKYGIPRKSHFRSIIELLSAQVDHGPN